MLKRAISYIWNTEKAQASRATELEYEKWSKSQLIDKIKELETSKTLKTSTTPQDNKDNTSVIPETKKTNQEKKKNSKSFDFSKHPSRFIALKFAYLGWNYNGLAYQLEPTPLPTVEEEILRALSLSKLIKLPDPYSCNFSRCGRTDKGVSAMNQVISLDVRSNLTSEDQLIEENDQKEIPYVTVLNSLLPPDIRITSVCLRPPAGFDARFSCEYRHYRYIFKKYNDLDIDLMSQAAAKYEGIHDFRNYCKIDGSKQITNYKREVYSAKIIPFKDDYHVFDLKGSAFLWHQVRCMVAVLFTVGQKLESPDIVDELLNVEKYPSKPKFGMAHDIPLVLYDCIFPEMEWIDVTDPSKLVKEQAKMRGLVLDFQVKAHLATMMENVFVKKEVLTTSNGGYVNVGDGIGRNFKKYIHIMDKEFGEPFEVVNERHTQKKKRKLEDNRQ